MKELSKWAKANPKSSRIIIVFSHLLVLINAVCFGSLLFIFNWEESKWLIIAVANLFFISYVFYPKKSKEKKQHKPSYLRQKTHDFSLIIFYFIVVAFGVNSFLIQHNNDHNLAQQVTAEFMVYKPQTENHISNRKKLKVEVKKLRKQIKQEFRELKKEIQAQKNKGGVIVLQILLLLIVTGLAIFLGALIAALACEISCSGMAGLAFVVLILGWTGIIWSGVIAINYILKKLDKS